LAFGIVILMLIVIPAQTAAWSNGGYTPNPYAEESDIKIGTHDFVAMQSYKLAGNTELDWIAENDDYTFAYYLGTEFPDNSHTPGFVGGGDTSKHHIYFSRNTLNVSDCSDDSSAVRAQEMYDLALQNYAKGNLYMTAFCLGAMTHYIADVAVFGHVMGKASPLGAENQYHHSAFETQAEEMLTDYRDDDFMLTQPFSTWTIAKEKLQDGTQKVDGDFGVYYGNVIPYIDPLLRDQPATLRHDGKLAPYYIAIQTARVGIFFTDQVDNISSTEWAENFFTNPGVIEAGTWPIIQAPWVEYYWDDLKDYYVDNNLPDDWSMYDTAVAYELIMAIAGVTYALEQFPNDPDYVDINGNLRGKEDSSSDGELDTESVENFFDQSCNACLPTAMICLLLPGVVYSHKARRRKK